MSHLDLDQLRAQVEAYQSELNREYYLNFSGQKPDFNLTEIYRRYGHIFARSELESIQEELDRAERQLDAYDGESYGAPSDEVKRLRFLYQFLLEGFVSEKVKDRDEALTGEEARAQVKVDGEEIPFRQLGVRIGDTAERERRARLDAARVGEIERRNSDRLERWRIVHRTARDLGYPDYASLIAQSRGLDLDGLARDFTQFLDETEDLYHHALAPVWRGIHGRGLAGAEQHDLTRLWRAAQFDAQFPKERVVEALRKTLAGLGIDLAAQKNIVLDIEPRPAKSPRAFCATVEVPDEVYLNILPKGGPDDYEAILHEAGHAEHFAQTDPHRPVEYRWLGDYSVTEAHAMTLEYLTLEPDWLTGFIGLNSDDAQAFRRFGLVRKLYIVRRYAGKLNYELELHRSSDPALLRERYTAWLLRSTLVHFPSAQYLTDLDDAFYAANYLRAWVLSAQLAEELRRRFGRLWFAQPGAGEFLRQLWNYGGELTAEELAAQIGQRGLDLAPLVRELKEGLA